MALQILRFFRLAGELARRISWHDNAASKLAG
jgi:hypothetical protein